MAYPDYISDPTHVEIVMRGADEIEKWRKLHPYGRLLLENADFSGANLNNVNLWGACLRIAHLNGAELRNASLIKADLENASIQKANLQNAQLMGASFRDAYLNEASFYGADLTGADLSGASLRQTDFRDTFLLGVNFSSSYTHEGLLSDPFVVSNDIRGMWGSSANIEGLDLSGARCGRTIFADVDLSQVVGLESVTHEAQSTIGIDTILKSSGSIPDAFLRGCGYDPIIQKLLLGDQNALIDATYKAEGKAIRLQSCFISYSTKDKPFVDRLQKALNDTSVDYWYAPEHGKWGRKLVDQIDREIVVRDRLLLVCSEASLNESDWVQWEIAKAVEQEKERGKQVLFPIMIDDALLNWDHPKAERLRQVLAADFRGATKGKHFSQRFERLVKALHD
jgi:hypothetical protein